MIRLPGRAVQNPEARIQEGEDNVLGLSGAKIVYPIIVAPQGESRNKSGYQIHTL
jgi:hypothetical protein